MRKEFPRVTPESVGVPTSAVIDLLDELENSELTDIHSLMIMRYGKVCAEGWWQPYAPGRAHSAWSLTKTYTATAVGIAIGEGLIGLDERLVDIFPEYAPEEVSENLSKMTVRNLLCMSSGVEDEVFGCTEDWLSTFMHSKIAYEPGTGFSYVSQGTNALGVAVARRAGKSLHEYLKEKLFTKLGMNTENMVWMYIPDGSELAAGGLYSTTEDNLRLMLLYLQGGIWEGERILPESYVKLATTKQVDNTVHRDHMPSADDPSIDAKSGYGFQIWMLSYPRAYTGKGAQGQYAIVFPNEEIIVSMTQTIDSKKSQQLFNAIYRFVGQTKSGSLPENESLYSKLKNRLSRLSIPCPPYKPLSPKCDIIRDKKYTVDKGKFTLYPVFEGREHMGTGRMVTQGIDCFSFSFDSRVCIMKFSEDGLQRELKIGMDGTRLVNWLHNPNQVPKEVHLSGVWESENVFIMKARWVESTIEKTITFSFDSDKADICAKLTLGTMGAFVREGENAGAIVSTTADLKEL